MTFRSPSANLIRQVVLSSTGLELNRIGKSTAGQDKWKNTSASETKELYERRCHMFTNVFWSWEYRHVTTCLMKFADSEWNVAYNYKRLTALCPGLPGSAGTREVKPIWILLKQETVSGISWAICKSAPCSRQITMLAPHRSVFYRPDALPATQPTVSKHWRQLINRIIYWIITANFSYYSAYHSLYFLGSTTLDLCSALKLKVQRQCK